MSEGDEIVKSVLLEGIAQAVDKTLQTIKGKPIGFCLLVFPDEDEGHTSFVANLTNDDLKDALGEFIDYLRGDDDE